MRAVYDLSRYPTNFNFVEFLVAATTRGATHIVFDDTKGYRPKFSKEETAKRLESILLPACALAGAGYSFGRGSGGDIDPGYHIAAPIKAFRDVGRLAKLKTVLPPAGERYTVTIRNSKRYKERNSDEESWRRFASEIGALVIEDFDTKPIHLHERMALYAGAEMNFVGANGPVALLMFSDYPFMAFYKNANPDYQKEHGFPVGSPSLPWTNERQKFFWGPDDYESIRKRWEER